MADFTENFQNTLPNPSNSIAYDGSSDSSNAGFTAGPGYASVQVTSKFKTMMNQTNSGTLVARSKAAQSFEVSISYNPLTEDEFNILYGFLLQKQGMLKPYLVPLPQYDDPKDNTLATHSPEIEFQVGRDTLTTGYSAGVTQMFIDSSGYDSSTDGQLRPGDMFNITDASNSNHTKAYKITRVETNADYTGTRPDLDELKISFVPPLQKAVSDNSVIKYKNPTIKVVSGSDDISYTLGNNNLYSFSLKAKEVQ